MYMKVLNILGVVDVVNREETHRAATIQLVEYSVFRVPLVSDYDFVYDFPKGSWVKDETIDVRHWRKLEYEVIKLRFISPS
uniref:Putative ovule protein n=1 Tax=Solanum chacoense TaxID=4108 RepID=A0A0V0GKA8_SOLCH